MGGHQLLAVLLAAAALGQMGAEAIKLKFQSEECMTYR